MDPAANTWTLDSNCTGNDPADEMTGRIDHGLAGLSNLSVGGVIRIEDAVSGTDTICGVWDENGQRCWRLYVNSSEELVLQLSADGSAGTTETYTMTRRSIDIDRNTFVFATWDGNTGAVNLYVDDEVEPRDQDQTGTLHNSAGPLSLGCATNNGSIDDSLVGVIGIVMADDALLTNAEIEYRAEEFTSRRGSYLNLQIAQ